MFLFDEVLLRATETAVVVVRQIHIHQRRRTWEKSAWR